MRLKAAQMRTIDEKEVGEEAKKIVRTPLYLILENIYDTYNVGGLFRLADGLAVEKIYLCGQTEIPPHSKIKKASIGTYKTVPWVYKETAKEVINELRTLYDREIGPATQLPQNLKRQNFGEPRFVPPISHHVQVVAIEQDIRSVPYTTVEYEAPVALLVGNETYGILPDTLKLVDKIVEIPMWGINQSLNVIVSAAIVGYWVGNKIRRENAEDFQDI